MKKLLLATFLMLLSAHAFAQLFQAVVVKKTQVVKRFENGDMIRYATFQKKKNFRYERIIELNDTSIITNMDTVPYYKIQFIHLDEPSGITIRKIGAYAMAAGILLPLGDLINVGIVQGNHYSASDDIVLTSVTMFGAGALMYVLDKPYLRMGYKNKLRIVNAESPLYKRRRELNHFIPN